MRSSHNQSLGMCFFTCFFNCCLLLSICPCLNISYNLTIFEPYTSSFDLAESCVFAKQSPGPILCGSISGASLLPKLRDQLAEFLNYPSPAGLRKKSLFLLLQQPFSLFRLLFRQAEILPPVSPFSVEYCFLFLSAIPTGKRHQK